MLIYECDARETCKINDAAFILIYSLTGLSVSIREAKCPMPKYKNYRWWRPTDTMKIWACARIHKKLQITEI